MKISQLFVVLDQHLQVDNSISHIHKEMTIDDDNFDEEMNELLIPLQD